VNPLVKSDFVNPLAGLTAVCPGPIEAMAIIRVSSTSLEKLANVEDNARRLLAHVPCVQYLDELPPDLLSEGTRGQRLRAQHDVVELRRSDVSPHATKQGALMGYLVPTPHGVVAMIHDSAALSNVRIPGDPLPSNAFGEFCVNTFATNPGLRDVHFAAVERWQRDDYVAGRIKQASLSYSVRLWNADKLVDLLTFAGKTHANIEGGGSSSDRDKIRRRNTVGVINALKTGKLHSEPAWPYAYALLAIGYDLPRNEYGDVLTIGDNRTKWRPVVLASDAEIDAIRRCLKLVASGASWRKCGQPLADAKVRCRGLQVRRLNYSQMSGKQLADSVRRMVGQHYDLLVTGRYRAKIWVPVPHDGTIDGHEVVAEHGTYGYVEIDEDWGLPEGGFMDEDTAKAVRKRLDDRQVRDGQHRYIAAFTYLPSFRDSDDDDFTGERRIVRHGAYYERRFRTKAECVDDRGRDRGWRNGDGALELSVLCGELEEDVAEKFAASLTGLHVPPAGLNRIVQELEDDSSIIERIADLEAELAGLRKTHTEKAALAAFYGQENTPQFDRGMSEQYVSAALTLQTEIKTKESALNSAETDLADARVTLGETEIIDLSQPAAVAGLLRGYAGRTAVPELSERLREMGAESLRLEVDPCNTLRVLWTITFRLRLIDGTTAALELSGDVNNCHDDSESLSRHRLQDAVALEFLRDGLSLDQIAERYRISRALTVERLRGWLMRQGVLKRGLRSAIADLPTQMVETRLAVWFAFAGGTAPPHLKSLTSLVGDVYRREMKHPNSYVRTSCGLARSVLATFVAGLPATGEDGIEIGDLARAVGATETEINLLTGGSTKQNAADTRYLGILVRDPNNRRVVRMRPCPHQDCDAAPGHRWLSHYLPVPETDHYFGLVCPSCHRLPDPALRELRLPDAYFAMLDAPDETNRWDLEARSATYVGDPNMYVAGARIDRCRRLLNIREAGHELGISDWAVREWILDETDPLPHTRRAGAGSRYSVLSSTVEAVRGSARHLSWLERSPRDAHADDHDLVSMAELATATGVPEYHLRTLLKAGVLVPLSRRTATAGPGAHLFAPTTLENIPQEWIERHHGSLLKLEKAAARAGVTVREVKLAMANSQLPYLVTDGGTRMLQPQALDVWIQERAATGALLLPRAVVERTGASYDAIKRAAEAGTLAHTKTRGGHLRFTERAVKEWADAGLP
jgi:hypothetical protein